MDPERRRFLRLAAAAATLPGAAAFLGPWLSAAGQAEYEPAFFSRDDFAALDAFTAILIPGRRHAGRA
jgi:hypothetical protein